MKKTRILLAMLMCIAMLASLVAVNVSAVGSAASEANFLGCAPTDAGEATHTVMAGMGVTVPADSGKWQIVDHFYKILVPADGYSTCYYVQTIEAPNGEVFAEDVVLDMSYALANRDKNGNDLVESDGTSRVGHLIIYTSADGQNWTESWADREGKGKVEDGSAIATANTPLAGTAGLSKLYVKVELIRKDGYLAGAIGHTKLTANTQGANEVVSIIDARNAQGVPVGGTVTGDVAHAEIERLGFEITEGDWSIVDCHWLQISPKDGWQQPKMVHTLEAGKGKVFDGDVSLTAGFFLGHQEIAQDDGSIKTCLFLVEVSTDGENWTEAYKDTEGRTPNGFSSENYAEGTITLPGTSGASKVYVRYTIERLGDPTTGALTVSKLVGQTKDAPEGGDSAPTGDAIAMIVALSMVCAAGVVLTTKKIRSEI